MKNYIKTTYRTSNNYFSSHSKDTIHVTNYNSGVAETNQYFITEPVTGIEKSKGYIFCSAENLIMWIKYIVAFDVNKIQSTSIKDLSHIIYFRSLLH